MLYRKTGSAKHRNFANAFAYKNKVDAMKLISVFFLLILCSCESPKTPPLPDLKGPALSYEAVIQQKQKLEALLQQNAE